MDIDLSRLNFVFQHKPLLIGGKAMEYYGLRKAGADTDLVVAAADHDRLRCQYPNNIKDIYCDIGVCVFGFEMWNQICRFDYDYLKQNAIEEAGYLVVAPDNLVFLKAIAMRIDKCRADLEMVVKYVLDVQYGVRRLPQTCP